MMKRIFTLIFTILITAAANAWIIKPPSWTHTDSIHLAGIKIYDLGFNEKRTHIEWGHLFDTSDCSVTSQDLFQIRFFNPKASCMAIRKPVPITANTSASGIFMSPYYDRQELNIKLNTDWPTEASIYSIKIYYYVYGNCDNNAPALSSDFGVVGSISEEVHTIGNNADLHILTIMPSVPLTSMSVYYYKNLDGAGKLPADHPIVKEYYPRNYEYCEGIIITDIAVTKAPCYDNVQEVVSKREMSLTQQVAGLQNENEILVKKYKSLNSADVNNDGTTNTADVVSVYNYISDGSSTGSYGDVEYVDLELPSGIKWATCNLGAQTPESTGDYYAYGEQVGISYYQTKATFTANNYIPDDYSTVATDYELKDDVVSHTLGNGWTMPSKIFWEELLDPANTTQESVTLNGVAGVRVTSVRNNKSIFFPAAGEVKDNGLINKGRHASYWTRTSATGDNDVATGSAYYFGFGAGKTFNAANKAQYYFGHSIRPVNFTP